MAQVAFDTLAFANRLKASGMGQKQAEAQAEAQVELLSDLINNKLVTKDDLKNGLAELRADLGRQIHNSTIVTVGLLGTLGAFFHFFK